MDFDSVGSYLPSDAFIEASENSVCGRDESMVAVEDAEVSRLVELQLSAGLRSVTSGELRRRYWDLDFYSGLGGIECDVISAGRIYQRHDTFTPALRLSGRVICNEEHPFFSDFEKLYSLTAGRAACRQTLPSPSGLYLLLAGEDISGIYPDLKIFRDDIAGAYRQTILRLYDLGCREIQIDDVFFGSLCSDYYIKRLLQGGTDMTGLAREMLGLVNRSVAGVPADMEISVFMSGGDPVVPEWENAGRTDSLLPEVLKNLDVQKYFMPFDADRPASFDVLRHIPAGRRVVLGLIDPHEPQTDSRETVERGVGYARRYLGPELLEVSPRCGFKLTSYGERALTFNDQWRKLDSLRRIAKGII